MSEEEKILKGLLGVLYVGMLSMTAYNGLVNLKKQRAANKKAEKVVGPEKPNELSQRDKVLKNIEESKKARESSNFSDYLAKEKEILAKKASEAESINEIFDLKSPVLDGTRVRSGTKVDKVKPIWGRDEKGRPFIEKEFPHAPKEHGFPDIVDNYPNKANEFSLKGGDEVNRRFFQIEGSNNGKDGVFEWVIEPNGDVSHRRFIEGGVLTGKPNQVPKN